MRVWLVLGLAVLAELGPLGSLIAYVAWCQGQPAFRRGGFLTWCNETRLAPRPMHRERT